MADGFMDEVKSTLFHAGANDEVKDEVLVDVDGILDEEEEAIEEKRSIYELLEEDIMGSDMSLSEKNERLS